MTSTAIDNSAADNRSTFSNHSSVLKAMLVTTSRIVQVAVTDVLRSANITCDCRTNARGAAAAAMHDDTPVVILTADLDWREFVTHLRGCRNCPNIILLMAGSDAALWADALQAGVFEALSVDVDRQRL